jgi:hypothetical protein
VPRDFWKNEVATHHAFKTIIIVRGTQKQILLLLL